MSQPKHVLEGYTVLDFSQEVQELEHRGILRSGPA